MKKRSGAGIIIAALSLLSIILTIALINNEDDNSLLEPFFIGSTGNISVRNIKAYQNGGIIYQEFKLSGEATCNDIMSSFDIKPLTVKNRIYTPSCISIDKTRLRIAYTPGNMI